MLVVRNIEKYYGSKNNVTRALNRVSFEAQDGEFLAVMGPSGSGKTTLLNCIATIDTPSTGEILLDGVSAADLKEEELARFRREQLGFVFQDANLLDALTLEENIALSLTLNGWDARRVREQARKTGERLGLGDVLDRFPIQVSGGQRQRAACARAIAAGQSLLLADEPTGALDSASAQGLLDTLSALNRDLGATILMVTHDPVSASCAGRVLFLKDGAIFHELIQGGRARSVFYQEILEVLSLLGGVSGDLR